MPDGAVQGVAGTGEPEFSGDGGPASEARLTSPRDVAVDSDGNLYIAGQNSIRKVDSEGVITTFAGRGTLYDACLDAACGDGGPAIDAQVPSTRQVAVDSQGNVYVLHEDNNYGQGIRIRRIAREGIIETLNLALSSHYAMAVDSQDNLILFAPFAVSGGGKISGVFLRVNPEGDVSTLPGAEGFVPIVGRVAGLARDQPGNTYFTSGCRIQRLTPNGILSTVAGSLWDHCGFGGDGGAARDALLGGHFQT